MINCILPFHSIANTSREMVLITVRLSDKEVPLQGGSLPMDMLKVSKSAKIRNRYNQVPHLTQVIGLGVIVE